MRLLALYLPQYHETEENNEWWGKGYTEWNAVKSAKTLCKKHVQPAVPLNHDYYDLADESGKPLKRQAELANAYGIYGFCFYHYWFGEKQLLQKPMEILLAHPEIDLRYCVCWANETWTRTWYGKSSELLIKQTYGDKEEWFRHYEYLRSFFKDPRYIKVDNRPLLHIYRQGDIGCLDAMLHLWTEMAKEDGFDGLRIIASRNSIRNKELGSDLIDGEYQFEPGFSTRNGMNYPEKIRYFGDIEARHLLNRITRRQDVERLIDMRGINNRIVRNYTNHKKTAEKPRYAGVCPRWDNTPRYGYRGSVYYNTGPEEFRRVLKKLNEVTDEDEFVYVNAWNEWGEGCYLEPDMRTGFAYLEAIREVQGKK